MPIWLWWVVMAVNAWTFLLFAWDKLCAIRKWRRIAEATLLWWMFACGCIGAWSAMVLFSHKTSKIAFRRWAVAATVLNPLWGAVAWQSGLFQS